MGNILSPATASLAKIMNLCSSAGATASTSSLSSDGHAESNESGPSEATHCFSGSGGGGGGGAGGDLAVSSSSRSTVNGGGGGNPPSSNGPSLTHNENSTIMPPETRPKMVTVKHPESNKPKPTTKKIVKNIQADQDVIKALQRCRDEGKNKFPNNMSINLS